MPRRPLLGIVLLAAALHLVGMARNPLPAQDGLKFVRFARQFHRQPWTDVVRGADQHPLYPALIALAQPAVAAAVGHGHDSWRLAAQGTSALASIGLLFPLFGLVKLLSDERTAIVAVFLYVLLPLPAEVGHDTLSDGLALLGFTLAFWLGVLSLRNRGISAPLGCGIAAGIGYLARPEVAIVPFVVGLVATARWCLRHRTAFVRRGDGHGLAISTYRLPAMAVAFLAIVGLYALVKGEVSEKLALRHAADLGTRSVPVRRAAHWLPPGLDDTRWDFSPKEESRHAVRLGVGEALAKLAQGWAEGLAWVLVPLTLWGAWKARSSARSNIGRWLVAAYLLVFGALVVRHAMALGYVSGRHTLSMVLVSLPWAAAGLLAIGRGLASRFRWDAARSRRLGWAAVVVAIGIGGTIQLKPGHPSRWGHWAAGRWLAERTGAADAVLDTRGWAAFVSGRPSYDYWHVRQAFTDSRLAYVVVGADELEAQSPRAETLRSVLAYAGTPVAAFPERADGHEVGVWVYRFRHPVDWEGLRP